VSVIVPFFGGREEARRVLDGLAALMTAPGDELIVADNTPDAVVVTVPAPPDVRVVHVSREQSSYAARNAGAEEATAEWLLFLDADCVAPSTLLDDYFVPIPEPTCGVMAGEVAAAGDQSALAARYSRARGLLTQATHVEHSFRPFGATANLLVRRDAWREIGGFQEGVVSSADAEFCWRLQDAEWTLESRPAAIVAHRHRERLSSLVRQSAKYGAGIAWVNRRYPGSFPRPRVALPLLRCAAGIVVWLLRGERERAVFKGIDAIWIIAHVSGYFRGNQAPRRKTSATDLPTARRLSMVVMTDLFPALSETFIANELRALVALGHRVRVEASGRPHRPERGAAHGLHVSFLEDDGLARRLTTLGWLLLRYPRGVARDWQARRRWAAEEDVWPLRALALPARRLTTSGESHIHVHFAGSAALNAMRIARLLGITYSLTAHAYDIYQRPRNLREKLAGATCVTSGCLYTVEHLRALMEPGRQDLVKEVVMGVDVARFRRRAPRRPGRAVIAVGRLVEKKGFAHLIDAAALLATEAPLERLVIIGDGPLRRLLEDQIARLELHSTVRLVGWRDPEEVRRLVEAADLLAMPCVVARDGDRDSMPVVAKEALALEVPVVASDEVGLPELVQDGWGRLVAPGDAQALADAIAELLALAPTVRADMGAAGRRWVAERCNTMKETEKLAALIAASLPNQARPPSSDRSQPRMAPVSPVSTGWRRPRSRRYR